MLIHIHTYSHNMYIHISQSHGCKEILSSSTCHMSKVNDHRNVSEVIIVESDNMWCIKVQVISCVLTLMKFRFDCCSWLISIS